jgi:replicative DNA helicase
MDQHDDNDELISQLGDGLQDVLDGYDEDSAPAGVPTGFRGLDAITNGLRPGSLTVIASRPGLGRTTLLSDICRRNAIADRRPVAVWTLEETRGDFATRLLGAEARVPLHHIRSARMDTDSWERLAKTLPGLMDAPIYIGDPAAITMPELAEQATRLVEQHGVQLLAVDGIQDIRPEKRSDLREREVGDVVRDLKTLARQLSVPVLATSHLNRGPEQRSDHRPEIDDLRESGAITYAADTIILLHRPDAYERDSPRAGEADLIVARNRHNPTCVSTVAYQAHYGRFIDMAEDWQREEPQTPTFDLLQMFGEQPPSGADRPSQ